MYNIDNLKASNRVPETYCTEVYLTFCERAKTALLNAAERRMNGFPIAARFFYELYKYNLKKANDFWTV